MRALREVHGDPLQLHRQDEALLGRPRPEQVGLMTEVRAALRACDRDALELLR